MNSIRRILNMIRAEALEKTEASSRASRKEESERKAKPYPIQLRRTATGELEWDVPDPNKEK